jgi:hypothetical protein
MDWTTILENMASAAPVVAAGVGWVYTVTSKKFKQCDNSRKELEKRIIGLEVLLSDSFPSWVRIANGTIVSVSPEFVKIIGAPVGYTAEDFCGKNFKDLKKLSNEFIECINDMENDLLNNNRSYTIRCGIRVSDKITVTIIKKCIANKQGVNFIGCLAPDIT